MPSIVRIRPLARVFLAIAAGIGLSVLVYFLAGWISASALAVPPAACTTTGCFCEAPAASFPVQLINSFSSLGFVFLGAWVLIAAKRPTRGTPEHWLARMFGGVIILIGASSFIYHSTLSYFGQFLDIFSMYMFGTMLMLGALYRSGRIGARAAEASFVALMVVLAAVKLLVPDAQRVLFAVLLLPGIVLELMPFVTGYSPRSPRVRFIYLGVATMVVAFVIWVLDQSAFFCSTHSPVQGHAIWHLLGAIAAVMIVAHYRRTEHPVITG